MKRIALAAAGALVLAACHDTPQPAAPTVPVVSSASGTVRVIVALRAEHAPGGHAANRARAAEIARELGVSPAHTYGTALFGFSASVPEGRLSALRRDPRVAVVDFDARVSLPEPVRVEQGEGDGGGGSTVQTVPWGVTRIGAETNPNEGLGIHVYIIDSGVDSDHSDLQANLGNGYAPVPCTNDEGVAGVSCLQPWDDDQGHGTHVAGTVGAINNTIDVIGVASQVTLHAVKVLNSAGSGFRSDIIAGVDWVASETAARGVPSVANVSIGGDGSKTGTCTDTGYTGTDTYHQAFCNAKNKGVVFSVSAGNTGIDAQGRVPASYDDATMANSATQEGDDWPSWSNWGNDTAGWTTQPSAPVAIASPGVSVLSTAVGGGTTLKSGTSMAAPHTAGVIALFLASSPQQANGTAFTNARAALLSAAESTSTFSNTSGNVHSENFVDARTF